MLCAPHFSTRLYAEWCKPVFFSKKKKERNSLLLSQYVTVFFFSDYIGAVCTLFLARRETYRRKTNCVSLFPIVVCFWLLCELLADVSLSVSSLCYTSFFRLLLFERRFITSRETRSGWWLFFPSYSLFRRLCPSTLTPSFSLFFIFSIWKSLCHVYWYTCKTEKRRKVIWKVCSEWSRLFLNIGTYTPFRLCQFSFLFFSDVSYSDTLAFFFLLQSSSVSLLFFFSQVVYDGSFCFVWSPTLLFFLYCIFFFF